MKTKFYLIVLLICSCIANSYAQAPSWMWARYPITSLTNDDRFYMTGMATDQAGNTYLGGNLWDTTITIENTHVFNNPNGDSLLSDDIVLMKYNSSGNLLWVKKYGIDERGGYRDNQSVGLGAITVEPSGNFYMTGEFYPDSIALGNVVLHQSNGGLAADLFLAKCDANGNIIWAKSAQNSYDYARLNKVLIDGSGYLYWFSTSNSPSIQFGNITLTNNASKAFVAKYDSNGNAIWVKNLGTKGTFYLNDATFDKTGNVLMTLSSSDSTVVIGSTTITNPSPGTYFHVLAKYDSNLNLVWAKAPFMGNAYYAGAIAADDAGGFYLTTDYDGASIKVDTITLNNHNKRNMLIAKFNSSGNVQWAITEKNSFSTGAVTANGIVSDAQGNCYLNGTYNCPYSQFGSFTLNRVGSGANSFLLKFNKAGNTPWAMQIGAGNPSDGGGGLTIDGSGNLYYTGRFSSPSVTLGSITLTHAAGYFKKPLAKLSSTVGIDDLIANKNSLIIYPNPLTSSSTLQLNTQLKDAEVVIYDILGKEMVRKKLTGNSMEIERGSLESGVYFVRVRDGEKQWVEKIIVE